MYYTNGNYNAYMKPQKPKNIDGKSAYIVGAGLAGLAAAVFLIRDGQMEGKRITIFEELPVSGGSMDAILKPERGYVMRGGREMEEHFETLWDLFRSIPAQETPGASILDEYAWENQNDPSFSYARIIENKGQRVSDDGQLTLSQKAIREILNLALTEEKDLQDKKINEVFTEEFFKSNFWLYWATMFAFEPWASAMEMRRYLLRFVHHIATLSNMSALRFTKYNQYDSLILPLETFLKEQGVTFQYNSKVSNVIIENFGNKKTAKKILLIENDTEKTIELTENDLVFITNGSITESSTYGTNTEPAPVPTEIGGSWQLWKNLAAQNSDFGRPEKFCENIPEANWVISGTITLTDDKVIPYIEKISKKNPHSGSIVTSGPVTIKDSNWLYGYSISRQPVFKTQKSNETIVWVYGLFSDKIGNYITKKITECNGIELCAEWLYHIGVPEKDIMDIATNYANTVPCYMPYITSYFCPRALGDRPLVVPEGSVNLAFIGNFAETEKDTVFTTEYSVRTAMEAVYQFLDIQRGVPEVFASSFDVRKLLNTLYYLNDQKSLDEIKKPLRDSILEKYIMRKIKGTYIEEIFKDEKLI